MEAVATKWFKVAEKSKFPVDGGIAVKYEDTEIAVFNFGHDGEWYAISNMCPHKKEMVLSRGMIGDKNGEPKVACPFHKKQFSLKSGECLDDSSCGNVNTYPVKIEDGYIYIGV
jgi:nitrite reductase (NADH) small subunit